MKKKLVTILLCAATLACSIPAMAQAYGRTSSDSYYRRGYSDVLDIRAGYPGRLREKITEREMRYARMVIIDGEINGEDIAVLRKLCSRGSCYDSNDRSIDNYVDLDLSRARIVSGGSYYSSYRATREEIGEYMFYNCSALRSVVLPEWTNCIRKKAFYGCNNLEDVMMPRGVRFIDDEAFSGCRRLRRVDLPDGLERIGKQAFYNCYELPNVYLPRTLREIGSEAFRYCPIRDIRFPNNLRTVRERAFSNTKLTRLDIPASLNLEGSIGSISTLTSINVENGHPVYSSIDGILYTDHGATLTIFPSGRGGDVNVPEGVTLIGKYAFSGSGVRSVYLPESTTTIGAGAFSGCSNLSNISFAATLKAIGDEAFNGCSSITSFVLPEGLTEVRKGTFKGCKKMVQVDLPASLTDIGQDAFRDCESLRIIKFPEGLRSIGKEAFRNCKSLDGVVVPASVTTLSYKAFNECHTMTTITLNEGLKIIEESALDNCNLLSLTIPSTVQVIDKKMVEKNKNLQKIVVLATIPPALKSDSEKKVPLYVPAQSLELYKNTKPWKNYKTILPIE